ncbi:MAG: hypothetical protein J0M04_01300 [Verrucomicrobia bacterium]|nr:hypothetical protein [Verrucomicrobiota bacterium]
MDANSATPDQHTPASRSRVSSVVARMPYPVFAIYTALIAFTAYSAMYAFRKPFTAAEYGGQWLFGTTLSLKAALVVSQILGYTVSKYIGVKVCSELSPAARRGMLVRVILVSLLGLLIFGLVPGEWKVAAIFLSGLPLGMVWGIVVSFLEGRRCSDFVMAALCGSFIVSSAVSKDVGRWLMRDWQVPENWMPAATGVLFLPAFLLAVWLLAALPLPNKDDQALRKPRSPMDKQARRAFLNRFAPGLLLLFVFYFFLMAFRDFRDNYGVEIFQSLGYGSDQTGLFTRAETPVAIGSLIVLALLNAVKSNRMALMLAYGFMMLGMVILFGSTLAKNHQMLGGLAWMVATGLGTYLAFAPINAVLFERLMAASGSVGTAVFGIQLADAIGYTGSVVVQLYKDLGSPKETHLAYFSHFSLAMGVGGCVLSVLGALYFHRVTRPSPTPPVE